MATGANGPCTGDPRGDAGLRREAWNRDRTSSLSALWSGSGLVGTVLRAVWSGVRRCVGGISPAQPGARVARPKLGEIRTRQQNTWSTRRIEPARLSRARSRLPTGAASAGRCLGFPNSRCLRPGPRGGCGHPRCRHRCHGPAGLRPTRGLGGRLRGVAPDADVASVATHVGPDPRGPSPWTTWSSRSSRPTPAAWVMVGAPLPNRLALAVCHVVSEM